MLDFCQLDEMLSLFKRLCRGLYLQNPHALIPIQIRIHEDALYISNDCVFPTGWTVETLLERHRSLPYNLNIANGFFRAGYVETWERGIEKICEACEKHGVPMPEYTLHPEDIMIKFTALQNAKIPKRQNGGLSGGLDDVLEILRKTQSVTNAELVELLNIPLRSVQRKIKRLKEQALSSVKAVSDMVIGRLKNNEGGIKRAGK